MLYVDELESIPSDESCEYLYEIGSWDSCALWPPFVRGNLQILYIWILVQPLISVVGGALGGKGMVMAEPTSRHNFGNSLIPGHNRSLDTCQPWRVTGRQR